MFRDREALYAALYTIADTVELWREYELKDEIDLLLYLAANIYLDESVYDSAIYFSNLGLLYTPDPDLYIVKGDSWLEMDQPDSALHAFTTACKLAPEDVFAVCGMGEALQQKEKFEAAMEYYDRALELETGNLWTLTCKASLLFEMNYYSESIELYSEIIKLDPSYYFAYFQRAGVYFELDDYELAIADYRRYLKYQPGDEEALYNIDAAEENMWNMN